MLAGSPFLPNWHIEAIAHALEGVRTDVNKRLVITVPPRHLKSLSASVSFVAWLLGLVPTRRIITVSYGDDLAANGCFRTRG